MTQSSPGCPEAAVLARYHERKLEGAAARALGEHVKGCANCQRRLARLDLIARTDENEKTVPHDERTEHPTEETEDDLSKAPRKPPRTEASDDKRVGQYLKKGAHVGRYVIRDVLGVGGMGAVYSAYDPELNRRVALKVLRSRKRSNDQHLSEDRSRLMREAQAMARLSHPNIVTVFDVGSYEGEIYIAMEMVQGTTLTKWLAEKKRSWKEIAQLFVLAGRGLAAAHAAGLVHRDFKPDNVLVGTDGRIRVMDFGLARPTGGTDEEGSEATNDPNSAPEGSEASLLNAPLTRKGILVGTPVYMAPEQFLNEPIDARADQFAFCVALYEALYGELPFQGDNMEDLAHAIVAAKVVALPKRRAVPIMVHRVLRLGLRSEPKDRFKSMDALLRSLDRGIRFRTRATGTAAVAALAAFVVIAKPFQNPTKVCPDPAGELNAVWGPIRQKALAAAFSSTKLAYAADTFKTVQLAFDDYARDWTAAKREACLATKYRHEQTDDALELKYSCLDRRRTEFDELVGLLMKMDTDLLAQSATAASSLSPAGSCADLTSLVAPPSGPEQAEQRAKISEQRAKLAAASARLLAGKYKEALEIVGPIPKAAAQLRFRPLEADALLLRGRVERELNKHAEAADTLAAASAAAQATRLYPVAAAALTELTSVVGFFEAHADEGRRFGKLAAGMIEGLGNPDDLNADLYLVLASVEQTDAKYADASSYAQRGLDIREKQQPDSLKVALALKALATAYRPLARNEEALGLFKRSLAILERLLGKEHPEVAKALNNLGITFVDLRRFPEAHAAYARALKINEEALGKSHTSVAATLNNLAMLDTAEHKYDLALAHTGQALSIMEDMGPENPRVASVLVTLAEIYSAMGKSKDALKSYERALSIREKAQGRENVQLASELTGIGETYLAMGTPRLALDPLERALRLRQSSPGFPEKLAHTRFVLARAIWDTGGDRGRAVQQATVALTALRDQNSANAKERDEVAAWLSKHSKP